MTYEADSDLELLAATAGFWPTQRLLAWFAGQLVYIPRNPAPGHPLGRILGPDAFGRVVAELGGARVQLPTVGALAAPRRDRTIAEMLAGGATPADIPDMLAASGHASLSVRRVEQIRAELEAEGWLTLAGGGCVRARGRPVGGSLGVPELTVKIQDGQGG